LVVSGKGVAKPLSARDFEIAEALGPVLAAGLGRVKRQAVCGVLPVFTRLAGADGNQQNAR